MQDVERRILRMKKHLPRHLDDFRSPFLRAHADASPRRRPTDAKTFLDTVNQTMLKLGIEASQAGWVQQNFITDDTEALGARTQPAVHRHHRPRREGDAALRQARAARRPAPAAERAEDVARDGHALRSEGGRRADDHHGAAERHLRQGQVVPRRGRPGHLPEHRRHHEGDGGGRAIPSGCSRSGKAGTRSPRRCGRITRDSSSCRTRARRELGFSDTGAMWRSKYDMPPDEFTKELDRLWDQVRPLYLKLHAYVRMQAAREVRRHRARERSDSRASARQHLGAGMGQHLSARVAPASADPGYSLTDILKRRKTDAARDGAHRRALLHVARVRAAAEDVLGALALHPAAGSRGRLPRERVGHRRARTMCASRCASSRRRRTSRPSTTSSATTSTSAPTRSSRSSSATARTTASTKRSATPSRCRSRPSIS